MKFLYRRGALPLEKISAGCQVMLRPDTAAIGSSLTQIKAAYQRSAKGNAALSRPPGARKMLDIVMIALGLAFFALSVGYTIACDRL
jgi:hypothetical protein